MYETRVNISCAVIGSVFTFCGVYIICRYHGKRVHMLSKVHANSEEMLQSTQISKMSDILIYLSKKMVYDRLHNHIPSRGQQLSFAWSGCMLRAQNMTRKAVDSVLF